MDFIKALEDAIVTRCNECLCITCRNEFCHCHSCRDESGCIVVCDRYKGWEDEND